MDDEQWLRAKQLLNDLLEEDPDDRTAWLDDHCGAGTVLRSEVEDLLHAYETGTLGEDDEAANWLRSSPTEPAAPDRTGQHVGPYRLVEEIGVGGMSVVYRAERADGDFEHTVAIKRLQRRLHSGDAEQRFRAERQVLASLDHPHIAQLHDGGVTKGGRPYLVMEYIDGTPITEYADTNDLDFDARLDLLEQVLTAVRAAHRQLVVHRDLKPSNVLVTDTEEGPQVKLLDFGIAKLLDDSMPVTAPQTEAGHHLMTPSYAAPEQITGDDVTTRTDVYQLGVLAYELLAGRRPFDLADTRPTTIERVVLEETPPAPSDAAQANANRLRGDLDTILQKALRKEPDRRYPSVEALATDLERHRAGTPIEARPATLRYRARKFVRRNRWGVGVAAAFLVVVALTGTMLVRQRNRAQREARRAQRQARTAEAVSSFMRSILGTAPTDSDAASGQTDNANLFVNAKWAPVLRDEIRENLRRLSRTNMEPPVRAAVLHAVGQMLADNHHNVWADSLFRRSLAIRRSELGPNHPSTLETLGALAHSHYESGRTDSARVYLGRYLRRQKQTPRVDKSDSARYAVASWQYATTLPDSARRARRFWTALDRVDEVFGPQSKQRALALSAYAPLAGDSTLALYDETLSLFQKTVAPSNASLVHTRFSFGVELVESGHPERGFRQIRAALRQFKQNGATGWYGYGRIMYAALLKDNGRYRHARSVLQRVQAWQEQHLPPIHKDRGYLWLVFADIAFDQKRYEAAATRYRRALQIGTKLHGVHAKSNRVCRYFLARSLLQQDHRTEATELLETNVSGAVDRGKWIRKSRRLLDTIAATPP